MLISIYFVSKALNTITSDSDCSYTKFSFAEQLGLTFFDCNTDTHAIFDISAYWIGNEDIYVDVCYSHNILHGYTLYRMQRKRITKEKNKECI